VIVAVRAKALRLRRERQRSRLPACVIVRLSVVASASVAVAVIVAIAVPSDPEAVAGAVIAGCRFVFEIVNTVVVLAVALVAPVRHSPSTRCCRSQHP